MQFYELKAAILNAEVKDEAVVTCEVEDPAGNSHDLCVSLEEFVTIHGAGHIHFKLLSENPLGELNQEELESARDSIVDALDEAQQELRQLKSNAEDLEVSLRNIDDAKDTLDQAL